MSMVKEPSQQQRVSKDPCPPPPTETHPNSRKRPLDSSSSAATTTNSNNVSRIRSSNNYFKMRSLLKDLRPHFIEVLRTPDFRNCKAAQEIREKLKLLMDLYMLMIKEPSSTAKLNNSPQQVAPGQHPSNHPAANLSETKPIERQHQPEIDSRGTYIIGGSGSGWNFITFPGQKPVYCGMTKESFRAAQVKLQGR
ncbi:uncharacterized protein LOC116204833 [Punica granatum]|uniref:Uncharacterized protein LOC116204833 n=2 Tax=Punica granatum TaxID=22663 RepID=A0A6P8DI69_PUNGR|nr:uncharacterized protein LOC116204833 [Punica granatum]PKI45433.1 hypothetical protein CRG98_034238 [Punica granatum]